MFSTTQIIYWMAEHTILGRLRLAASGAGLCKLAFGQESDEAFFSWLTRVFGLPGPERERSPLIEQALTEIAAYMSGELGAFETPLDIRGTSFQQQVWTEVARIPYGTTATYGEIATRLGRPKAVRAVGAANGANPLPLFVPCHRVVGADGALRGYGGGLEIKAALLELESRAHDLPVRFGAVFPMRGSC